MKLSLLPFAVYAAFGALAVCTPGARAENNPAAAVSLVTLDGKPASEANTVEADQRIKTFKNPVLHLFPAPGGVSKGTVLVFPGGGYGILSIIKEGENTARVINEIGFDAAVLEYHINSGPETRDLALADALKAFRLLKSKAETLGLHQGRFGIAGYSAGGHLAARTTQNLGPNEQPDDLILLYPAYLQETAPGAAAPKVQPPDKPGRLFVLFGEKDKPEWIESSRRYLETWKSRGGTADFQMLLNMGHGFGAGPSIAQSPQHWPVLLKAFLVKP